MINSILQYMPFKAAFDFRNQKIVVKYRFLVPLLILILAGIVMQASISDLSSFNSFLKSSLFKQLIWLVIGISLFLVMQYVRIQYLYDYSYFLFPLIIFVLFLTLQFGVKKGGATSWIQIGGYSLGQPSEFMKILYVLFLARFLSDINKRSKPYYHVPLFYFFILLPLSLLAMQPDLGTGMIYLSIIIPILYWNGIKEHYIYFLISPVINGLLSIIDIILHHLDLSGNIFLFSYTNIDILEFVFFISMTILTIRSIVYLIDNFHNLSQNTLSKIAGIIFIFLNYILNISLVVFAKTIFYSIYIKSHWRTRIVTMFYPESDPFGSGWQVIQSKITIGSGGIIGKGWKNGTQANHDFLPVPESDFILSILSEEFGFLAILTILLSLVFFIYYCFDSALRTENRYASTLIIGFSCIILMHFLINMCMISGLLPVVGLPVPFISYGGSFMLTCGIILGIINNISNNHL